MATQRLEVYKCNICAIVVEALEDGAGEPVCCGQPMQLLVARTADAGMEKHVPFIEPIDGGYRVTVGKAARHPMEPKHYIQWIDLLADGGAYRRFLKPGDEPHAEFRLQAADVTARQLCNIHGLWTS